MSESPSSPEILDPLPEPVPYDANRPPAEIEADIARTRAALGETLVALEGRVMPRQLLEKGVDMLRDSMDGNLGRVGEALRANPLPLALIAGGVGWLILSRSGMNPVDTLRQTGVGDVARRVSDMASDAAGRVKETVRAGPSSDTTSDRYAYARPKPGSAGESFPVGSDERLAQMGASAHEVPETAGRAPTRFREMLDEYPLAVGVLGFLAGVALALALPSTRLGDGTLGEARNRLVDETKRRARRAAGALQEAVAGDAEAAHSKGSAGREG